MGDYLDRWRDFLLELMSGLMEDADEFDTREDLLTKFDVLFEISNRWGLSKLEFLTLIFAVCTELYPQVDANIASFDSFMSFSKKQLTYGAVILAGAYLFDDRIDAGKLIDENSFLNEIFIVPAKGSTEYSLKTPIKLKSGILSYFLGSELPIGQAALCVRCVNNLDLKLYLGECMAHADELEEFKTMAAAHLETGMEGLIHLRGEKGSGKKYMVGTVAAIESRNLMILDATRYFNLEETERLMALSRILQKLALDKYLIYIDLSNENMEDVAFEAALTKLLTYISRYTDLIITGGPEDIPERLTHLDIFEIRLRKLTDIEQQRFFKYFSEDLGVIFDEDVNLSEIASKYRLNAGKIRSAIKKSMLELAASSESDDDLIDVIIGKKILEEQIRRMSQAKFGKLATRLSSNFTFDDITVSSDAKEKLIEIINRVIYRGRVLEEFGFDKKLPYGRGLTVALYGPPGTGKTMAANVLANELGLDIYRIDLSQISSKYVGESEKNIGAVFDAAKDSNAILFFDEADALFAKRTDVSSSNDKHSNSETAFLLQKMEEYDGISILATNVMQNFDAAFKRRITYMISIDRPGVEERLKMWQKVFPENTPLSDDVKLDVIAAKADIPGSSIKSAALSAAFRAAARGSAITHEDIAIATDEEYKKTGHTSILRDLLYGLPA